jgi:hypothetical protein
MRTPLPRNSAIDEVRIGTWVSDYAPYVPKQVNKARIDKWLSQFSSSDRDLAARLLDGVQFYNGEAVGEAFKTALRSLSGWSINAAKRKGTWRFVELSNSGGESGSVMVHRFRVANGLDAACYKELFIGPSQLADQGLGPDHTIVFLDDFAGTGKQVCDGWADTFQELAAGAGRTFLILAAAFKRGRDRIQKETELQVFAAHLLGDKSNIFSDQCEHFTAAEKQLLLKYCERASSTHPRGWGECGLAVVFYHRCPNGSVPVLHVSHSNWKGLFPRHA